MIVEITSNDVVFAELSLVPNIGNLTALDISKIPRNQKRINRGWNQYGGGIKCYEGTKASHEGKVEDLTWIKTCEAEVTQCTKTEWKGYGCKSHTIIKCYTY